MRREKERRKEILVSQPAKYCITANPSGDLDRSVYIAGFLFFFFSCPRPSRSPVSRVQVYGFPFMFMGSVVSRCSFTPRSRRRAKQHPPPPGWRNRSGSRNPHARNAKCGMRRVIRRHASRESDRGNCMSDELLIRASHPAARFPSSCPPIGCNTATHSVPSRLNMPVRASSSIYIVPFPWVKLIGL